MLTPIRRAPILAAAMTLGLTTAAASAAATAPRPASEASAVRAHPDTAPHISTLPTGDRVLVTGSGPAATVMVLDPSGRTVPAVRYAPDPQHAYVIPDSAMSRTRFVASQYEIPVPEPPRAATA